MEVSLVGVWFRGDGLVVVLHTYLGFVVVGMPWQMASDNAWNLGTLGGLEQGSGSWQVD